MNLEDFFQTLYQVYNSFNLRACFIFWLEDLDAFDRYYQVDLPLGQLVLDKKISFS
jgi:hypothetical protein